MTLKPDTLRLKDHSNRIRRKVIELANRSKSPHVGSCLSCVDILVALYFHKLKLDPWDNDRDICILSKGHAAMSLYATLYERGILSKTDIDGFYQDNGTLPAHLDRSKGKGIEVSAGSLGHGFNIGLGMAYGFIKQNSQRNVYAIIGDGESQEGSIWEGALFAPALGIHNFTAILDHNNLQGYGRPLDICHFEPIREKWESFGWHVCDVDGHDHHEIIQALNEDSNSKPKIIITRTTKGKGVSFMENELVWHYFVVTDDHKNIAMEELT